MVNKIFKFWKTYTTKQKKVFVCLCLFFFLTSNIIGIRVGYCSSSPCGEEPFNDTSRTFEDDYGELYTNVFLAPSAVFVPSALQVAGYETSTEYHMIPPFIGGSALILPSLYQQVKFDSQAESLYFNMPRATVEANDLSSMRFGYALIKLIIVLSLPVWGVFSFIILKLWTKSAMVKVGITLLLFWILLSVLFSRLVVSSGGSSMMTATVLFGLN